MAGKYFINDHDLETDLGVTVKAYSEIDGWAAGVEYEYEIDQVPGDAESIIGPEVHVSPRVARLAVLAQPAVMANRGADISKLLDWQGMLELRSFDSPNRVLDGVLTKRSARAITQAVALYIPDMVVPIEILCPNPSKRDRDKQTISFSASSGPVVVPTGNLACSGSILEIRAATNPVVTLYNLSGEPVESIGFTLPAQATGDYLRVHMTEMTAKKYVNGVFTPGDTWSSGYFFHVDSKHGNFRAGMHPKIGISSGEARLMHYRRYDA